MKALKKDPNTQDQTGMFKSQYQFNTGLDSEPSFSHFLEGCTSSKLPCTHTIFLTTASGPALIKFFYMVGVLSITCVVIEFCLVSFLKYYCCLESSLV